MAEKSLQSVDPVSSGVLQFFIGKGVDSRGRTHRDIAAFGQNELENSHDYIQWLWPLHEPSAYAVGAPILTPAMASSLAESDIAHARFVEAISIFRNFLGVAIVVDADIVALPLHVDGASSARIAMWAHEGDHNCLRITRILRSLRLVGMDQEAKAFYRDVSAVGRAAGLSPRTLSYWRRAAEGPVWETMQGHP